MHTQDFVVDQSAYWQVLECLTKLLPDFHSVFVKRPLARVFEAVDLVNEAALVVPSQHVHFAWVPQFLRKQ